MQTYDDATKAEVIAQWLAGASLGQLAGAHHLPRSTVQGWVKGLSRTMPVPKTNALADYDFDGRVVELIDGSVRAFSSILAAAEDPTWIKRHSPDQAAILAGVIADKLYRLLGAIDGRQPASTPTD